MNMSMNTLNEAFSLHQTGELEKAITLYQTLLSQSIEPCKCHELLGIAYAQQKNYPNALGHFKKALKLAPNQLSIKTNLATCYKKMGQNGKAIAIYQDILKYNPSQCIVLNNLATLYIQQKNYLRANTLLKKAITLQPEYPDAYFNLGLISDKPKIYFDAAANLGHGIAAYQLAQLLEQDGNTQEAKQYYQLSIEKEPNHGLSHHGLARVLLALGKDEDAIKHFIEAQKIDPYMPHLMENIGAYYHVKGMYANAVEYWSKALQITDNPIEINYNIGVSYHYMNRHEDALTYFMTVLAEKPNHAHAHMNVAAIALQNGQFKQAITHYEQALEADPNNTEVQYILSALKKDPQGFTKAPEQYVANLFDQYASYYNQHLTKMLRYQLPEKVELILHENLKKEPVHNILDLGCGTGLMGATLLPFSQTLTGVDLSQNMLLEAKKTHAYTHLHQSDCVKYLQTSSVVDVILALELCPYLGDLEPLFQSVKPKLKHLFIFSIETTSDKSHLSENARFQHNPEDVKALLTELSFTIVEAQPTTLRTQNARPVPGYLFVVS